VPLAPRLHPPRVALTPPSAAAQSHGACGVSVARGARAHAPHLRSRHNPSAAGSSARELNASRSCEVCTAISNYSVLCTTLYSVLCTTLYCTLLCAPRSATVAPSTSFIIAEAHHCVPFPLRRTWAGRRPTRSLTPRPARAPPPPWGLWGDTGVEGGKGPWARVGGGQGWRRRSIV
jgi:hypothetical protein